MYLPPNYNAETAGGNITASTSLALNFGTAASGGSITNTGTIESGGTLAVSTGTLTNQQNTVNVGNVWNNVTGGYTDTTGTEAQSGGFMSAANMTLNAQTINQIGGALQIVSSDGTVNAAATQQLVSSLQAQLGSEFQQSTVSSNLNTSFTAAGGFGLAQLAGIIVAVVAACLMQPEISTAIASVSGAADAAADAAFMAAQEGLTGSAITAAASAAGGTLAVGGLANTMLAVGLSSIASGALSQYVSTGQVNLGTDLSNGLISAVTAGITNGITFDASSGPGFNIDAPVEGVTAPSLAALSGVQNVAGALVPQAGAAAGSIPEELLATGADASIQAGVQTAIEGGSFLNNLKTDAVNDAGADAAYAIGDLEPTLTNDLGTVGGDAAYILAHAALGCATSAAEGTGCGGGAIGAASSAALTPFLIQGIDPNATALNSGQLATVGAVSTLIGSVTAGLAGQNAQAGGQWAQNEALNNDGGSLEHTANAVGIAQAVEGEGDQLLSGIQSTFASWVGSSAASTVKQTALQGSDLLNYLANGTDSTVPYTPQSALGQSIQQNGFIGTGAQIVSNTVSTYQALASGNPQAIASLYGTLLATGGMSLLTGGAFGFAEGIGTAESDLAIQFGANANQASHAIRHLVAGGYDVTAVQDAVTSDLNGIGSSLPQGQYNGTVSVNGTTFNYSAYKLPNGTINVGRITPP